MTTYHDLRGVLGRIEESARICGQQLARIGADRLPALDGAAALHRLGLIEEQLLGVEDELGILPLPDEGIA